MKMPHTELSFDVFERLPHKAVVVCDDGGKLDVWCFTLPPVGDRGERFWRLLAAGKEHVMARVYPNGAAYWRDRAYEAEDHEFLIWELQVIARTVPATEPTFPHHDMDHKA